MRPDFYPNPCAEITHKETHISHLFFAGDLVYKVKKPVHFSFLDYSSLAKRRHFLEEELRLNRRLAPSVYLGIEPIVMDKSGWHLDGSGEPVEYTLLMRRLPEKRMMRGLLETRQVTKQMMRELAKVLADFHNKAERVRALDAGEYFASLKKHFSENLTDLERYISRRSEHDALGAIGRAGMEFLQANKNLLVGRVKDGWIRDVHGDLHTEHICFAPEGIQIFDCIEFNASLRRCELASEIAFLSMDIAVRGGESLRSPFLDRYRELLPDPQMPQLLSFFECYRALVRAKVHALRIGKWSDETARYFRFAQRFAWARSKPFVVLICGFSGSGKSALARALGERLDVPVYNSDLVRKEISGIKGRHLVALNEGIYAPATTAKTYAAMAYAAEKQIIRGNGVILDATFGARTQRQEIARLAALHRIPLAVIHCSASDAVIERRLRDRAAQGADISDARWEIYVAQKRAHERIDEFAAENVLELDTDAPIEELVQRCEEFLRLRLPARGLKNS
jgi:hypothetical protein